MVVNSEMVPEEDFTGHPVEVLGPRVQLVSPSHLEKIHIRKVHLGNQVEEAAIKE